MSRTISAYNGRGRGDGYDAHMRPVRRSDNAPGGVTHVVRYVSVPDGDDVRTLWCDSEAEARHAALHGPAAAAEEVR